MDINADTIKCGTPNAMPVGWTPTQEQLLNRRSSRPAGESTEGLLTAIGVVGLVLALIALLPEFDGTHPGDWDQSSTGEDGANTRYKR